MKVTEITGYSDNVEDTINERIKYFEEDYSVRVISIDVTHGGALEYDKYSVWLELEEI